MLHLHMNVCLNFAMRLAFSVFHCFKRYYFYNNFQVRDEINLENLANRYLVYLIKKECWDDMETKGKDCDSQKSDMLKSIL